MSNKIIKHQFNYAHPKDKVWEFLTNPELMAQWLMKTDFEPVVGHDFNFLTNPRVVNTIIIALILLNLLAVCLETVENVYRTNQAWFNNFELFSITVFTVEYLLRIWSCTSIRKYRPPIKGRLRYMTSPGALVNLIAILPFYLPLSRIDLRSLRSLRMIRFIRFFKLGRFLNASRVIRRVFASKKEELTISVLLVLTLVLVAASVMYFVEHDAQPDKLSSISETMWWSVATLTTVGYGDVYPVTGIEKTLTAVF